MPSDAAIFSMPSWSVFWKRSTRRACPWEVREIIDMNKMNDGTDRQPRTGIVQRRSALCVRSKMKRLNTVVQYSIKNTLKPLLSYKSIGAESG